MSTKLDIEGDRLLPEPLRSLGILTLLAISTVFFAMYTTMLMLSFAARHLVPVRFTKRVWELVSMEKVKP
jgi:hypothetical protein